MIRLLPDQSALITRTAPVEFSFDGRSVLGHDGETVLAALLRSDHAYLRDAPEDGAPRGAFCCMGLCQECVVEIDGLLVESCRLRVSSGLVVRSLKREKHV
ncbi:MAG: (2Fe-2S)-binding protein [Sulfitobacter sp.]